MASGCDDSESSSRVLSSLLSSGNQLSPEWKALTTTDQRIYFVNQRTRSTHWFPPPEFWISKLGLPYGWEEALDSQNKKYYINHVNRTTTREDPRSEADQAAHHPMTPSQARRIELHRDATIGFGFVAGSEKPVVIRSVILNGPSFEKLFANDQILKVNGKDVRDAPQADVISLIKSASGRIELEVVASEDVQDAKNQHNRKSSLMSRTTRERRRSTPVSVRFADEPALVQVIGPMEPVRRSSVPLIPNVLKVFLENGQTRSFRYDSNTTAEEIFRSLSSKLDIRLMEHFSLVLSGPKKGQISYIQNHEKISEIYTNRNCSSVNCLCKLNIAFVPKDHFYLLSEDPNAFEYLYSQVTNRVVECFYGMDLKYDLAIKLAALQIQQKAVEAAAGRPVKISVRQAEKEFGGLGKFVSADLLHSMREKELRKVLDQQIKQNENLAPPGERHMNSLQCKIHYLNLSMEIFSYGGRYFDAILVDNGNEGPSLKKIKKQHITVLVSLKYGVSQVVRGKVNVLCQLAEFHEITGFKISRHEDNKRLLRVRLQEGQNIQLICSYLDCVDIIALITGYYKVYVDNTSNTPLPVENDEKWPFSFRREPPANDAPDFYSTHHVIPDVWSYPSHFQSAKPQKQEQEYSTKPLNGTRNVFIDLSRAPPRFQEGVISEESNEEHAENTHDQPSLGETDEALSQQFDSLEPLLSQDEEDLLKEASSFLYDVTEDSDSRNMGILTGTFKSRESAVQLEESVTSLRQHEASPKTSGEQELGMESSKTAVADKLKDDRSDLISELLSAEEVEQQAVEEDVGNEDRYSLVSFDEIDSCLEVAVDSEEQKNCTSGVVEDRNESDFVFEVPGQVSPENTSNGFKQATEEIVTEFSVVRDAFGHPDLAHNTIGDESRISLLGEGTNGNQKAFPGGLSNFHLALQRDSLMGTDSYRDQTTGPSDTDVKFDESKLDDRGMDVVHHLERRVASEGSGDQEILSSTSELGENPNGDFSNVECNNSNSSDAFDDAIDAVGSHMISLGFDDSSDTDSVSESSDGEESLCSTFPEYFQRSSHVKYSGNNKGILVFTEEVQNDAEGLLSTEGCQSITLVSLKDFQTKDEQTRVSPAVSLDHSLTQEGVFTVNDLEELSTASSESFEFTYEVNTELESKMLNEDLDDDSVKQIKEESIQEIHENESDKNYFPRSISSVSYSFCSNDEHNVLPDTETSLNAKGWKINESMPSSYTITSSPYDETDFCENTLLSNKANASEKPNGMPEIRFEREESLEASSRHFSQTEETFLQDYQFLNDLGNERPQWKHLDRSYSPTDWIIPSPPTPTPELREDDLQIVSPPPIFEAASEDEFHEDLNDLIVPSPPSLAETTQNISNIRIVSPPPSVDFNHNEIDVAGYDFDDIRFLSLTDDHKLAHSNVVSPRADSKSNITEDRKIQAKKLTSYASSMSKREDSNSKQMPIVHQESCNSHLPGCSFLRSWDSSTKSQPFAGNTYALSNLTNVENVNLPASSSKNDLNVKSNQQPQLTCASSSANQAEVAVMGCTKIILKQKPPIPPKPRFSQTVTSEDVAEARDATLCKGIDSSSNFHPKNTVESNHKKVSLETLQKGFSAVSAEDDTSMLGSRLRKENTFKESSSRSESLVVVRTQDQCVGTPKTHSPEVVEPGMNQKWNFITIASGRKTSARLESSCPETPMENREGKRSFSQSEDPPLPSAAAGHDSSKREINTQHYRSLLGRSVSFSYRSAYVPVPYVPSRPHAQTLTTTQPSMEDDHEFVRDANPLSSLEHSMGTLRGLKPRPTSSPSSPKSSSSLPREDFSILRMPALKKTSVSLSDSNEDQPINLCALLETSTYERLTDSSVLNPDPMDFDDTIEFDENTLKNVARPSASPPLPDSSPPPLPPTSPPKTIPRFDEDEFDFDESLFDTEQDSSQSGIHGQATFAIPSSAKDLKSRRSLASFCHKRDGSKDAMSVAQSKLGHSTSLYRSLTLTTSSRGLTHRSFSDFPRSHGFASDTERPSLRRGMPSRSVDTSNIEKLLSLDGVEPKHLGTKLAGACEKSLSKLEEFRNRLEAHLAGSSRRVELPSETNNVLLVLQNNARFLACDVKVISSSMKRGEAQVAAAVRASLDSMEELVKSCEKARRIPSENSSNNVCALVSIVTEVLDQYRDVIATIKATITGDPNSAEVELAEKANAVTTTISTLIRTLRKY